VVRKRHRHLIWAVSATVVTAAVVVGAVVTIPKVLMTPSSKPRVTAKVESLTVLSAESVRVGVDFTNFGGVQGSGRCVLVLQIHDMSGAVVDKASVPIGPSRSLDPGQAQKMRLDVHVNGGDGRYESLRDVSLADCHTLVARAA
jgi:hypothetical protein